MLVALWIAVVLLAFANLAAGAMKVMKSKVTIEASMDWAQDFSAWQIKTIGALELLGAFGMVLPLATGIAPVLTAVAAIGLALIQLGAIVVHLRRNEMSKLPANVVLILLAAAVAVLALVR
jgi:DoxX-like family